MIVHYCDRCGKAVESIKKHKIPDAGKGQSATSYSMKEVDLCDACFAFVRKQEEVFLSAIVDTKFAFYRALMEGESKDE